LPGVRSVRWGGATEQNGEPNAQVDVEVAPPPDGNATLVLDYVGDERGLGEIVKALAYADITVTHFAEQSSDLEDIFMQVTRGVTQ
jgi:ABC-2 type transport system ATP-binding protein